MSTAGSARRTISLKGLTPLLDTVFLLVFALLSLSKTGNPTRQEPVRVRLPLVEQGSGALGREPSVVLEIDKDSRIRDARTGHPISAREDLDRLLSTSLHKTLAEEAAIEIHADRAARNGTAVALLQHLRLRGFVNVTLLATGSDGGDDLFGGPK